MSTETSSSTLSATYTSTSNNPPFTIFSAIPTPSTTLSPVDHKTAYLTGLRASVLDVQERINKELTTRMEQDNAASSTPADSKEEENYGEEMQEED